MMPLHRNQSGAAMIFGLFFALFLLGAVWSILGVTQALLYRDQVQDAADAAAFSSAVVNARGMNLIVLLNMLMAALLSILIGIRIGQTVCAIGGIICLTLSVPTGGLSLEFLPTFTAWSVRFQKAFESAKKPVHTALHVIHTAGKAASVAVPIASNLRVLDLVAASYDATGFAVPSRLSLPIEDDEFPVLCGHSGSLAAHVAMLPFRPILHEKVQEALDSALTSLTSEKSDWFCGGKGKRPEVTPEKAFRRYPDFPSRLACEEALTAKAGSPAAAHAADICNIADYETMAAIPARDGSQRLLERVCPTECKASPRASCPPAVFEDCSPARAATLDGVAVELQGQVLIKNDIQSPYVEGLKLALRQCRPPTLGGPAELQAFGWVQHGMVRTYRWDKTIQAWLHDTSDNRSGTPSMYIQNPVGDKSYPCGPGGIVDDGFDPNWGARFVCEGMRKCLEGEPAKDGDGGACDRSPPGPNQKSIFREEVTQVTRIVSCAEPIPQDGAQVEDMNLRKELEQGKQNINPFRVRHDTHLGTSDFQVRAIVVSHRAPPDSAASWIAMGQKTNDPRSALVEAAAQTGRLGLAQAEYFFDWSTLPDTADREEWMWNMGWRARLRPFRLTHSKADPATEKKPALDPEQQQFVPAGADLPENPAVDCQGKPDCADASGFLGRLLQWEEP